MMVMIVIVVIVIGLPAGTFGGAGLGPFDRGRADERIGPEHHAAADRLASLGVAGERSVLDRLAKLEPPGLFARTRHSFINVGNHGMSG
jgi:hypothetical protein